MGNLREAYQSSIANRANEIMRVFTAITTVFMPLTVITGIYGMNFTNMPELNWKYSYFVVIGLMVTLGLSMFFIFRKKTGYELVRNNKDDALLLEERVVFFYTLQLTYIPLCLCMPTEADANHAQFFIDLLQTSSVGLLRSIHLM